eukprot:1187472-Prorocentrum_minimum.AAC.1
MTVIPQTSLRSALRAYFVDELPEGIGDILRGANGAPLGELGFFQLRQQRDLLRVHRLHLFTLQVLQQLHLVLRPQIGRDVDLEALVLRHRTVRALADQPARRHLQSTGTERVDSGTERADSGTERADSGTERVDSGTERVDSGTERVRQRLPDQEAPQFD